MPADREITLDEWIAAGQACCGSAADDDPPPAEPPADYRTRPTEPAAGPASDSGSGA